MTWACAECAKSQSDWTGLDHRAACSFPSMHEKRFSQECQAHRVCAANTGPKQEKHAHTYSLSLSHSHAHTHTRCSLIQWIKHIAQEQRKTAQRPEEQNERKRHTRAPCTRIGSPKVDPTRSPSTRKKHEQQQHPTQTPKKKKKHNNNKREKAKRGHKHTHRVCFDFSFFPFFFFFFFANLPNLYVCH